MLLLVFENIRQQFPGHITGAGFAKRDRLAQIGNAGHAPTHMKWCRFLSPKLYQERFRSADLVVAHAGTGVLMTARACGRPLLLLPRLASLGETRNEHQRATANCFSSLPGVLVADGEDELLKLLDRGDELVESMGADARESPDLSEGLITRIQEFISTI